MVREGAGPGVAYCRVAAHRLREVADRLSALTLSEQVELETTALASRNASHGAVRRRSRNAYSRPKATCKVGPRNGRQAREGGLWRSAVPRHRDYGAGAQVLGLRTASTTSRIAAMTSSGWSW
jgi:hypothetical protein